MHCNISNPSFHYAACCELLCIDLTTTYPSMIFPAYLRLFELLEENAICGFVNLA